MFSFSLSLSFSPFFPTTYVEQKQELKQFQIKQEQSVGRSRKELLQKLEPLAQIRERHTLKIHLKYLIYMDPNFSQIFGQDMELILLCSSWLMVHAIVDHHGYLECVLEHRFYLMI